MSTRNTRRSIRLAEHDACLLGRLPNGKRVYRFNVLWRMTDTTSADFASVEGYEAVTATSAAAACNWVRDSRTWTDPVEIWTRGPRGGRTSRFMGYESIVAHAIMARVLDNPLQQISLDLENGS